MATKARGDERKGQDDDEGQGSDVRVVQIENAYHEKLRERLRSGGHGNAPASEELTAEAEEKPAAPVIYNDDGSVYKRPG